MDNDNLRTALEAQIAQEKAELEAVPKIPIERYMGIAQRCHLCGAVVPAGSLTPFDEHIPGGPKRLACMNCHPNRGLNGR